MDLTVVWPDANANPLLFTYATGKEVSFITRRGDPGVRLFVTRHD